MESGRVTSERTWKKMEGKLSRVPTGATDMPPALTGNVSNVNQVIPTVKNGHVRVLPGRPNSPTGSSFSRKSEHSQVSSLENSSRSTLGAKLARVSLKDPYTQQLSKSNPPQMMSALTVLVHKAHAYCRLRWRISRAPKHHRLKISITVQSNLSKEKTHFPKNKSHSTA